MELKEYLALRRVKHKETARQIAKKLGITEQYLSKLASKTHSPSRSLAKEIETISEGLVTCMELLYP